ncbi:MAG: hypothetical protein ACKPKO_26035, partial [Candidatus Fonsibacter sp.]
NSLDPATRLDCLSGDDVAMSNAAKELGLVPAREEKQQRQRTTSANCFNLVGFRPAMQAHRFATQALVCQDARSNGAACGASLADPTGAGFCILSE